MPLSLSVKYFIVVVYCVLFPFAFCQFEDSRCRCDCPSPRKMFKSENFNMTLSDRKIYIKNSAADDCGLTECYTMAVSDVPINKVKEYCLQCGCQYQSRNTTTIKVTVILMLVTITSLIVYLLWLKVLKYCFVRGRPKGAGIPYERYRDEELMDDVVVILVICVIGLLVVYLLFLLCLDPMLKQPRKDHLTYERQENDEDNIFAGGEARSGSINIGSGTSEPRPRRTSEVLNKVEQQQNRWFAKVHEQRRKIFKDHTMLN